jgi:hypothetical protein
MGSLDSEWADADFGEDLPLPLSEFGWVSDRGQRRHPPINSFQEALKMAVLPTNDRIAVWAQWMQENKATITGAMTKADLQAAVNALDDFLNTNATAINNAIPAAARGALSTAQKAALLNYVVARRWGVGV